MSETPTGDQLPLWLQVVAYVLVFLFLTLGFFVD
jgi:hypothetical protein